MYSRGALTCISLLFSCVNAASLISFEPIAETSGLMFERISALRHVSDQRFVFVQTIDYYPVLHDLLKILNFVQNPLNNANDCMSIKLAKPHKTLSTYKRISQHLSMLTQINNEFVNYEVDSSDTENNEVFADIIHFDHVNTRRPDNTHEPPHWSWVSVGQVKALLAAPPHDFAKMLTTNMPMSGHMTMNKYEECIRNNCTIEERCLYLAEIHKMISHKLADADYYANTLYLLIEQTRRNKLNVTNNVVDDNSLLREMRQISKILAPHNLKWVVDFDREIDSRFDLSQIYKLHLYVSKTTVVLCIAMPLTDTKVLQYSLYKIGTVPFCKGTMCLMMVPATSHIAVTDTRNFYTQVPVDFETLCKQFTGYNEFICPTSPRIATFDSGVCEIEIFMGRHMEKIDLCDVRVADNNSKQTFAYTLVDGRKWLYAFSSNATVDYWCNNTKYNMNVQAGVGLITAQPALTCSVHINGGAIMFNVDTRYYVTSSRSYWPSRLFDYTDYVNATLLSQTSTSFADVAADLSIQQLKTLRSKFYIRNYMTPPRNYFTSHNHVREPKPEPQQNNWNIIALLSASTFITFCVIGAYCVFKRQCLRQKHSEVEMSFINCDSDVSNDNSHQFAIVAHSSAHTDMQDDDDDDDDDNDDNDDESLPKKALLFPMEIKHVDNKIV